MKRKPQDNFNKRNFSSRRGGSVVVESLELVIVYNMGDLARVM